MRTCSRPPPSERVDDREGASRDRSGSTAALDANKALIRRVFEEVIPAGDSAAMRDLMAPGFLDHDPLPRQPAPGLAVSASTTPARLDPRHPRMRR